MPLYGRSIETSSDGLHRLSEVSLDVPLDDLRRIAHFLLNFVEEVEAGTIRTSHLHMDPRGEEWDVIVFHPSPEPPRRVK